MFGVQTSKTPFLFSAQFSFDMEEQGSKPVPSESFSYSWLVKFPGLESLNDSRRRSSSFDTYDDSCSSSSFIEMDPRLPPSKRFLIASQESFRFDFPTNESLFHHADELLGNGYVTPLFLHGSSKLHEIRPSRTLSSIKLETRTAATKIDSSTKYWRLSKRLLLKYLHFLTPLCGLPKRGKNGNAVAKRRSDGRKSTVCSEDTSPRLSVAFSADGWRRSCDSETSIHEAVLHCKKSFGKHHI